MENGTLITGFPRIGENRELKKALESFWSGKSTSEELALIGHRLRKKHWCEQREKGIEWMSSNDFSYYDGMLDAIIMLNAIPKRFRNIESKMEQYFAMARGRGTAKAMEMTKWFNTNYHFIVPELEENMSFALNADKIIHEYQEAKSLGIKTKINLIGPITFVGLSKTRANKEPFEYFEAVLEIYKQLIETISLLDETVYLQIEEPLFVRNPIQKQLNLIRKTYEELSTISNKVKIIVTTYFEHSCEATVELAKTGIWGIGLDFVEGIENLKSIEQVRGKKLIAGIVDGRNIWKTDFKKTLQVLDAILKVVHKENIILATSCSLLHVPYSLRKEPESPLKKRLAFAIEKVEEISFLGRIFKEGISIRDQLVLEENQKLFDVTTKSFNTTEEQHVKSSNSAKEREGDFQERIQIQKKRLNLPILPTTTIGSFPQTYEIRQIRRKFKKGEIDQGVYESHMKAYIDECIRFQETAGLDVLVHGEPERNDMVEYFAEQLKGFHCTVNGWVQSYGSRCVKPPILFGNISRPNPMTVKWIVYAQNRTKKTVKAILTGPMTMMNWSFVRNDLPTNVVSRQLALALSDEVNDLQNNGIKIIQIDEAAFKEGYPLRKENISDYETMAIKGFKYTVSTAKKETQIHTHMCYSEFRDIIKTIEAMDADVISIETVRSGNKLLKIFQETGYKNEIGPGVYDIHSPRIPTVEEFKEQILQRIQVVEISKIWINPDCGLKTRKWEQVKPALTNMVQAVRELRTNMQ